MKLSLENTSEANQATTQQVSPGQANQMLKKVKAAAEELGAWIFAVFFIMLTAQVLAMVL